MASVNKVIVLGNMGRDPELRYAPAGGAVCNVSIATTRTWKNKDSGEKMEETEWHRVTFFDRMAEVVDKYVRKGDPIYVEGRLRTRKWQNKEGQDQYTTEILADSMQLLGSRRDSSSQAPQSQAPQRAPQTQAPQTHAQQRAMQQPERPRQQQERPRQQQEPSNLADMDDDIPF